MASEIILSRFTQHVNEQNWFAVGLDFIVVVVGIFVGLQVTEWNEERQKASLEHQYIVRLHADMVGTLEDAEADLSWNSSRMKLQKVVLDSLRSGVFDENNRANFNHGLAWLGLLNPIRHRCSTVEELNSTENLAILRDVELR